jgi:putative flippase GtrA
MNMAAIDRITAADEAGMAVKFALVGLVGLAVDTALLRLGIALGVQPAIARVGSLFTAMQVTFAINGLHVFRCLTLRALPRQWTGYMLTNGVGNLCNYWIFVTLVSLHREVASNIYFAVGVGSASAYVINYAGARLIVFGKDRAIALAARRGRRTVCGP